jgi:hypothetical protein
MAPQGVGPYTPLNIDGEAEDRIRLLSLAPGCYDDPIEITLTTYLLRFVSDPSLVVLQKLKGFLDDICKELLKVNAEEMFRECHLLVQEYADLMKNLIDIHTLNGITSTDMTTFLRPSRTLLKLISRLIELPPYKHVTEAVSGLSRHISHIDPYALEYDALSYAWGTDMSLKPATVSGYPLEITESLDSALRHLRHADRSRVMWIDAICINQNDISERNHQVQLMGTIYAKARQTVVWLGSAADGSDLVMDGIAGGDVKDEDMLCFSHYMHKLMARPWWSRSWIIQEVALARAVLIQCGMRTTSFFDFCMEFRRLKSRFVENKNHDPEAGASIKKSVQFLAGLDPADFFMCPVDLHWEGVRDGELAKTVHSIIGIWWTLSEYTLYSLSSIVQDSSRQPLSFPVIHERAKRFRAKDPRDLIYSLLSISSFHGPQISPDYGKTTASVFSKAMAVTILENFPKAYLVWPLYSKQGHILGLPSWVPNMALDFSVDSKDKDLLSNPVWEADVCCDFWQTPENTNVALKLLNGHNDIRLHPPYASFSDDFDELHTVGSLMGTVIRTVVIDITRDRDIQTVTLDLIREGDRGGMIMQTFIKIREFLKDQHISAEKALSVLTGYSGPPSSSKSTDIEAVKYLLSDSSNEILWPDLSFLSLCLWFRTIFLTDTGHVGLSVGDIRQGDILAGLFGIKFPFILRRADGGKYTMVNVAHVAEHELSPPWRDRDQRFRRRKRVKTTLEKFTII